jgi:uncharacterized protein (TIGR03435 family)
MAYGLKPYEFAGPEWLTSARFDIMAKAAEGATQAQKMAMLRNLLEDRFGLKVHREPREMTVYELAITKGGPKFHEAVAARAGGGLGITYDAEGIPELPPGGGTISGLPGKDGVRTAWGVMHEEIGMERLASILGSLIGGRPVTDATGLKGTYDLAMHWEMPMDSPDGGATAALFEALQSQLGLKLESKKGTVEVTVVDHCERTPSGN